MHILLSLFVVFFLIPSYLINQQVQDTTSVLSCLHPEMLDKVMRYVVFCSPLQKNSEHALATMLKILENSPEYADNTEHVNQYNELYIKHHLSGYDSNNGLKTFISIDNQSQGIKKHIESLNPLVKNLTLELQKIAVHGVYNHMTFQKFPEMSEHYTSLLHFIIDDYVDKKKSKQDQTLALPTTRSKVFVPVMFPEVLYFATKHAHEKTAFFLYLYENTETVIDLALQSNKKFPPFDRPSPLFYDLISTGIHHPLFTSFIVAGCKNYFLDNLKWRNQSNTLFDYH